MVTAIFKTLRAYRSDFANNKAQFGVFGSHREARSTPVWNKKGN